MTLVERMDELRSWVKTPWRHQGRVKGSGVDCIGVVLAWADICGALAPEQRAEIPNYGRIPHHNILWRYLQRYMDEVPLDQARAGDVLCVAWRSEPMHLGVLSNYGGHDGDGPLGLIHASLQTQMVVEQPFRIKDFAIRGVFRLRTE